ncbi:hypothetical protein GCM10009682_25270 [Luedemannella flava]|uniref:DUF58 domain-containing protein n=1 Tax=Luedemannella flava TaxID=349316 RepID=A0ABP4Y4M1_9ACTN
MRASRWSLNIVGSACLTAGVLCGVWALVASSGGSGSLVFTAVVLIPVGLLLLGGARSVAKLDTSALLRDGMPGTAQVLSVRDTGTTIGDVNLVVQLHLRVTLPGRPPYRAAIRHVLQGRTAWSSLRPGMVVPVRVDRANPGTVAVAPVEAEPTLYDLVTAPTAGATVTTVTADDIVAAGVASYGQVLSLELAGHPDADGDEDPPVQVGLSYVGPNGTELQTTALVHLPDGKEHLLAPGRPVPVSYLPDSPETATIDWSRV